MLIYMYVQTLKEVVSTTLGYLGVQYSEEVEQKYGRKIAEVH